MGGRSRNRAKMERLVARWRASGETLSGFARRHGVSRDKLQYWNQRLSSASPSRTTQLFLMPVQLLGRPQERDAALEVVLAGTRRVRPDSKVSCRLAYRSLDSLSRFLDAAGAVAGADATASSGRTAV